MSLSDDIKYIKEKVTNINNETVQKSLELNNLKKDLKELNLQVSNISYKVKNNGIVGLLISFEIPPVIIDFDDEGHMLKNDKLIAFNNLNLISFSDANKIQEKLIVAQTKNNE